MRSLAFTLLLTIFSGVLAILAFWQIQEGNLNRIIGAPALKIGDKIYPDFSPEIITRISLRTGETEAIFEKNQRGWFSTSPWTDRMDPRAAVALLSFANTTSVVDLIPRHKLDPGKAGFATASTEIIYSDKNGKKHAFVRLGRRTPWLDLTRDEKPQPLPTTYLLPLESGRKSHVYAATGDLSPLFKDGFRNLRDHCPLQFNPLNLSELRIKTPEGELTLSRKSPQAPWRITKPLDLATDPESIKSLLEGLYELRALGVNDRAAITLPTQSEQSKNSKISLTQFGAEQTVVLDIFPASLENPSQAIALVSDRPETVFTLPVQATADIISLSELPLTVNELRDPSLARLNLSLLKSISVKASTTPDISLTRGSNKTWMAATQTAQQAANEQKLFDLLLAISETKALAFETDAAPNNLSNWGLDRPVLELNFSSENGPNLVIRFGLDRQGNLFAKRENSPTIIRVEPSFLKKIAVNYQDWRHARAWSISKVDLTSIIRIENQSAPLDLQYNDLSEEWKAVREGKDVTGDLDTANAKFLLNTLENLKVSRWLPASDETAKSAFSQPILRFLVTENQVDEFGDPVGQKNQRLIIGTDSSTGRLIGGIVGEPSLFEMDAETLLKLAIPLLDE